jgi:NNP family nitrate/nitrite transporter-like MFS transporter
MGDVPARNRLGVRQGERVWHISDEYPPISERSAASSAWPADSAASCCWIMFGALMDLTGALSAFMLMYGVVWVSLIWMYWTEVRHADVMGQGAGQLLSLTDPG